MYAIFTYSEHAVQLTTVEKYFDSSPIQAHTRTYLLTIVIKILNWKLEKEIEEGRVGEMKEKKWKKKKDFK